MTSMGGGRSQYSILCRRRPNSGLRTQLVADDVDGGGTNFHKISITDKYGKENFDGLYPGVHLRAAWRGVI